MRNGGPGFRRGSQLRSQLVGPLLGVGALAAVSGPGARHTPEPSTCSDSLVPDHTPSPRMAEAPSAPGHLAQGGGPGGTRNEGGSYLQQRWPERGRRWPPWCGLCPRRRLVASAGWPGPLRGSGPAAAGGPHGGRRPGWAGGRLCLQTGPPSSPAAGAGASPLVLPVPQAGPVHPHPPCRGVAQGCSPQGCGSWGGVARGGVARGGRGPWGRDCRLPELSTGKTGSGGVDPSLDCSSAECQALGRVGGRSQCP